MRMLFLAIVILIPRVDSVPLLTVMTPLVPVLLSDAEADLTVGQDTAESTRSNVETTTEVAPPVKALTVNREDWMREAMSDKHRKEVEMDRRIRTSPRFKYGRIGPVAAASDSPPITVLSPRHEYLAKMREEASLRDVEQDKLYRSLRKEFEEEDEKKRLMNEKFANENTTLSTKDDGTTDANENDTFLSFLQFLI